MELRGTPIKGLCPEVTSWKSPENQGELHKWPPIVRFPRKDELIAHKEQKLSIQSLVLPSLIFD